MADDNKPVTVMSPTSFISEIMLILMGFSGLALLGVNIGFFSSLSMLYLSFGISVGIIGIIFALIGIYVLLYHNYNRLKYYLIFLTIFVGLQLTFIIYLYFFTNDINLSDQEQGSIITLDVCFGFSASALVALCLHLKQKGSTIEMVKL